MSTDEREDLEEAHWALILEDDAFAFLPITQAPQRAFKPLNA